MQNNVPNACSSGARWILPALLITQPLLAASPTTQTKPTESAPPTIVLEAADADQHGTLYSTERPGYTGAGYVTGFFNDNDYITFHPKSAKGGIYEIDIRYSAPGIKGFVLNVNGIGHEDTFDPTGDAFATHVAGKIELKPGDNTIEIRKGWGHYDIDRIELIPTEVTPVKIPSAKLVNPDATPAARALMQTLVDNYGKQTYSGVFGTHDAELVVERTGVRPSIMGADLIEYSPSRVEHGSISENPPERLIADYKAGYILTVMWHWNAPTGLIDKMIQKDGKTIDARWYRAFYTEATTFDVADALKNPNGHNYQLLLRDIDAIAVQLKKLSDANVPVLWRPLHEADGGWFWWGAKGPDAFKQLWSIMYDRLTHYHHLNNLIWVYTGSEKWDWYPPADQFDVIGVDLYPQDNRDPSSALWDALQAHYGGDKLLTISECGAVPDVQAMAKLGVHWSYFDSWFGRIEKIPPEELKALYHEPLVKNLPVPEKQPG